MKIDRDFANWLAGFVDGEGCFFINMNVRKSNKRIYLACWFIITLRADDSSILRKIQKVLGFGTLTPKSRPKGSKDKPTLEFRVTKKEDCSKLVELFSQFPLRAKKSRDFKLWAKAVKIWLNHKHGDDWTSMLAVRDKLMRVRKYKELHH